MFSTKGLEVKSGAFTPKFIGCGVQVLTITGNTVRTAQSGKKMVLFNVETQKVQDEGFEPHEDAKFGGQIGRVKASIYFEEKGNSKAKEEFIEKIATIAQKLNVRDKIDEIKASSTEDYVNKVCAIFSGKYLWLTVTGEEYLNMNNEVRTSLGLRRFGFAASLEEGESHLKPFDIDNPYDYKKVAVPDQDVPATDSGSPAEEEDDDDLPF